MINKPTWHTTQAGMRVLWTRKWKHSLALHLGTVSKVGKNQGSETIVTVILDEDQKAYKARIGDLEWVKKGDAPKR